MTRHEQHAEIERAAREVWGKDVVGQVIVGRGHVAIYAVGGIQTLLHIEHEALAVSAALAALRVLNI